jgi:hypothetical protein
MPGCQNEALAVCLCPILLWQRHKQQPHLPCRTNSTMSIARALRPQNWRMNSLMEASAAAGMNRVLGSYPGLPASARHVVRKEEQQQQQHVCTEHQTSHIRCTYPRQLSHAIHGQQIARPTTICTFSYSTRTHPISCTSLVSRPGHLVSCLLHRGAQQPAMASACRQPLLQALLLHLHICCCQLACCCCCWCWCQLLPAVPAAAHHCLLLQSETACPAAVHI